MAKYLMVDHGGVLDGEMITDFPGPDDLLLSREDGYYQILKNGVSFVRNCNELVYNYGYKFVFHSENSEEDRLRILKQLDRACVDNGITFPPVFAMGIRDPKKYPNVSSDNPTIIKNRQYNISIAAYDIEKDGKACLREALSVLLDIKPEERAQSIVFDDDASVIKAAHKKGYQTYHITGDMNLHGALTQVIEHELSMLPESEKVKRKLSMRNKHEIKDLPRSLPFFDSRLKGIYNMVPSVLVGAIIAAFVVTQFAVNPFAAFLIPFAGMEGMKRLRAYSARNASDTYYSSGGAEWEAYQAGMKAERHLNDYIMAPWYSYLPTFLPTLASEEKCSVPSRT